MLVVIFLENMRNSQEAGTGAIFGEIANFYETPQSLLLGCPKNLISPTLYVCVCVCLRCVEGHTHKGHREKVPDPAIRENKGELRVHLGYF